MFNAFSPNLNYGYITALVLSLFLFYLFKLSNGYYIFLSWLILFSMDKLFKFYALLPFKAYEGFIYICVNALILSSPIIIIKIVLYTFKRVTLTSK